MKNEQVSYIAACRYKWGSNSEHIAIHGLIDVLNIQNSKIEIMNTVESFFMLESSETRYIKRRKYPGLCR